MFFFEKKIAIKSRFIVLKMTVQITKTQQKRKKLEKMKGGREMKKKLSKFDHLAILGEFWTCFP